jgi:hypothetical protein
MATAPKKKPPVKKKPQDSSGSIRGGFGGTIVRGPRGAAIDAAVEAATGGNKRKRK